MMSDSLKNFDSEIKKKRMFFRKRKNKHETRISFINSRPNRILSVFFFNLKIGRFI